ncbi:MAG TPA: rhomboid family intramembrane serine protease [Bacteroidales bacterium]|nr:rhomboid family intramembrane serine protease [Bacteroidales bacterium]
MTIVLIIITTVVSVYVFQNPGLFNKLQLSPFMVVYRRQWYRLFSHGFIHADWIHLIVNMIVLYSFGTVAESVFDELSVQGIISHPKLIFILMYISSVAISSLFTLIKEKDNISYASVGASGAVSTVVFLTIFFFPIQKIYFYAIIPMPGILFGILYLIYSQYMSMRSNDNINHDAHFIGALYGLVFPLFIEPDLIFHFADQIRKGLN